MSDVMKMQLARMGVLFRDSVSGAPETADGTDLSVPTINPATGEMSGLPAALAAAGVATSSAQAYINQMDTSGVIAADSLMAAALAASSSGDLLVFPKSATILLKSGYVINKRIGIEMPESSSFNFIPTTPGTTLFTWTFAGSAASDLNEETQLDGVYCHCRIKSNRSVRANGVRFIKVDNVSLDIRTFGLKGFSVNFQKSREAAVSKIRTRFCGYLDPSNPANNVADLIFESPDSVSGDTTNYCKFGQVFSIYPLGPGVSVSGSHQMVFSDLMIHMIRAGFALGESTFVNAFGGSTGWTGGVANNEMAGLHVNPGGDVATVAGRVFDYPYRGCVPLLVNGKGSDLITKFVAGEIVGAQISHNVMAVNNGELHIGDATIKAASSTQYSSVITSITSDVALLATTGCPVTGTPCKISNTGGVLPSGIVAEETYYLIRIDATHAAIATSLENALAGTIAPISGGSGTNTLTALVGYVLTALDGGKIMLNGEQTYIDDGYQAGYADSTSLIVGEVQSGDTFAQGPVIPRIGREKVIAYLKNADMTSTADQQLTKTFGCHRYCATRVVFRHRSGAYNTACVGGIYTSAGKVGNQIVPASQSFSTLTGANTITQATVTSSFLTPAAPYLSLTTGNGAALTCDVFLFGVPMD